MYLNKKQITSYIKCPFGLAIETAIASSRQDISSHTLNSIIEKIGSQETVGAVTEREKRLNDMRNHIMEIASYEMKNGAKLSKPEYRTKYTNKFYSKGSEVLDTKELVKKLNVLFEIFSENAFLSYNSPIDIPIQGTSLIYRDSIDFILTDQDSKIFAVDLVDLSDMDLFRLKLTHWVHYHITYSFLAASFEKEVNVTLIDPVDFTRLVLKFYPEKFDIDLKDMKMLAAPIQNNNLIKNLHMCPLCKFNKYCN